MEVYIKKEKKDGSINNQRRFKKDGFSSKKRRFISLKKRWMKDKRWIKEGSRPSGNKRFKFFQLELFTIGSLGVPV